MGSYSRDDGNGNNMEKDLPTKRREAYPYQVYHLFYVYHLLYVSITFTAAGQKRCTRKLKNKKLKIENLESAPRPAWSQHQARENL